MGAMSSYLFIIKTELPAVLRGRTSFDQNQPNSNPFLVLTCPDELCRQSHDASDAWYYNGDMILILVTLCVVMPLASFRNIEFLGYTSGFSISCMVFFTIVIIAKYFIGTESCPLFDDGIASGGKYNFLIIFDDNHLGRG